MSEGTFRRDLYDRLTFKEIMLPALRERAADVAPLVEHFRQHLTTEIPWVSGRSFTLEATEVLARHSWPGNVRELKNVVERLLCSGDAPTIDAAEVALELGEPQTVPRSFAEKVADLELQLILDSLRRSAGNQRQAAEELELTYDQFRHLYKKYRIKERLSVDEP